MIDLDTGRKIYDLEIEEGHDFNGHAVFSADGSRIIAAEQDAVSFAGRLGIYDSESGRPLAAWSSHGPEPHELILDRDRNRMIIANGGIIDRNAVGEVDSSLVSLDLSEGSVLTRTTLPEDLLSLSMRHMALTAGGDVLFGAQDQDPQSDLRPIVGLLGPGGDIRFLEIPRETAMTLRGYIGSVAVDSTGWIACATSPKGNVAMFWNLRHESWLGQVTVPDGCGVCASGRPGGFIVTGGKGDILSVAAVEAAEGSDAVPAKQLARDSGQQWDNHLTRIPI